MPPHGVLGLSWGEWLAVASLIGIVYAGFRKLIKSFADTIAKPLSQQMKSLSKSIDDLTTNSLKEHNGFDRRLDKHDIRLAQHDTEIGTLYSSVGLRRKERDDEGA